MDDKLITFALFDLDKYTYLLEEKEIYSTSEERSNAEKYTYPQDNYRLISYIIRRIILAKVLKLAPLDIKYNYNQYGKPYEEKNRIYFNVSHTKNWFVIGLSLSKEIGIDAEVVQYIPKMNAFISSFSSKEEKSNILSYKGLERDIVTHLNWCLKESFVKAQGNGLTENLQNINIKAIFNDGNETPTIVWYKDNKKVDGMYSYYEIHEEELNVIIAISTKAINTSQVSESNFRTSFLLNPDIHTSSSMPTDFDG